MAATGATSTPVLSECWEVQEKHVGCYTGGKVAWLERKQKLCCLCDEELHLVDSAADAPTQKVAQEGDGVLTFAVDPAGENACTSHRSGLLRHFKLGDAATPSALLRSWKAHDQVVADVCFDATGALVATGSVDRTVKVWDFTGYFCTHNFKGHSALVSFVRFHPAKLELVSVADAEVRLWDLNSSTCVGVMKDHLASISSICFAKAASGAYNLVTGARDQVVNVWRLEKGCGLVRSIPVFESVEGVAAVPTGALRKACQASKVRGDPFTKWLRTEGELPAYLLFTVGDKGLLRAWNPGNGKNVASRESPHAAKGLFRHVLCLDEADGRKIVTIGEDLNLVIWSLPELQIHSYLMGHNEEIVHVQMVPKLSWQVKEDEESSTAKAVAHVSTERFVCIANDEHPRLVNCHGFGALLLRGHTDVVISCDVSADGLWIATGGKDQNIRVWSADAHRCVCLLSGHVGAISGLSFSKKRPKSAVAAVAEAKQPLWLVSGGQDKTMKVWELPTPEKLAEVAGDAKAAELEVKNSKVTVIAHTKEVNDITVSPNAKLIASGGQDKLVRVWQFPEGDLLGECKGHRKGIWCVAFSPVDQVIASASGDGTVRIWSLKDYTAIRAFQGHDSAVLRVCFLSGGMQLMTSAADGLLKLWHVRTADCAATLEEHEGKVWCIDVVGDRMVSGGSDSKLCIWRDVTSEKAKERQDLHAEEVMKDSRIGVLLREGKTEAALTLALELDRPAQMRQILTDYAMKTVGKGLENTAKGEANQADGQEEDEEQIDLQRWVMLLKPALLEKLVDLLEKWNSNRRMASLAQMLMGRVLLAVPSVKLRGIEGMNATCATFLSYSSRHMARVEAMLQKTFLFDLVLQSSRGGLALQDEAVTAVDPGDEAGGPVAKARGVADHPGADAAAGGTAGKVGKPSAEEALRRTMDVLLGSDEEDEEVAQVPDEEAAADSEDEVLGEVAGKAGCDMAEPPTADAEIGGRRPKKKKRKGTGGPELVGAAGPVSRKRAKKA